LLVPLRGTRIASASAFIARFARDFGGQAGFFARPSLAGKIFAKR